MKKTSKKSVTQVKKPLKKTTMPSSKKTPEKKPAETAAKIESIPPMPSPKSTATPMRQEAKAKVKAPKKILPDDDLPLDLEEKEDLLEEERRDLAKALKDEDDDGIDASFVPTDTSERYILVVDEDGQRRNETTTIISQILPNAIVEVADDPEEAWDIMQDCDFDTFVVNFLMPGFSASPFVKAVANHPEHPLLLGFAADKISDAVDPKKGLKIIPLKRLFDLDANTGTEGAGGEGGEG